MIRQDSILGDQPGRLERAIPCSADPVSVGPARSFRQIVDWGLAGFFFSLAMLGVLLPGLPTTPFLLLMCHFLIRVSPSLHAKAMVWPVVGGPLRDWYQQGGVSRRVRVLACTTVVLLVGATLLLGALPLAVKAIILLAAGYGLYVVVRLPAAKREAVPTQFEVPRAMCSRYPNRVPKSAPVSRVAPDVPLRAG